jgi:hypothetical protein
MPLSAKRLNSRHGVERGWAWKEHYPRESKDTTSEKAFCLVAPTVLLSDLAILLAGVFCFARLFSSRTSVAVHARLLAFLAMLSSQLRLIQTIGVNNGFSAEMSICSATHVADLAWVCKSQPAPDERSRNIPVMLPPGRAMLATSPASTGSISRSIPAIGIVRVAFLAAAKAHVPRAKITSTLRLASSIIRARIHSNLWARFTFKANVFQTIMGVGHTHSSMLVRPATFPIGR